MTSNSTWAGMIAMNLQVHLHCSSCDTSTELDLASMPPEGKAIGAKFRCNDCGRSAAMTVSHRSANHSYPGAKPLKIRQEF